MQLRDLVVVKRSGRKVPFDRDKLVRSIDVAVRKRAIDREQLVRNAISLSSIVEAKQRDDLASHYLDRAPARDPGPVPQTRQVLGERA